MPLKIRKGVPLVVGAVGLGFRVVMTDMGAVVRGAVKDHFDHQINTGEKKDEFFTLSLWHLRAYLRRSCG